MAAGGDYAGWGWEQVLTRVLGIGIPDRTQVTGQSWLTIRHGAPADPGMHLIFTGSRRDSRGAAGQSIQVYLNPAVYMQGGAWDSFVNTPARALSGVPAAMYGTLPVRPPSFQVAERSVASVASWLAAKARQFADAHEVLTSPSTGITGNAADVIGSLMLRLSGAAARFNQQLTTPVAYSGMIGAAGAAASSFLSDLWSAYSSWEQQPGYSPLGALVDIVQGVAAAPDPTKTSYGDLTSDGPWAQIEGDAKTGWSGLLVGSAGFAGLDPLSRAALGRLVAQYESTAHVLDPLLGPGQSSQNQPGSPPSHPGGGSGSAQPVSNGGIETVGSGGPVPVSSGGPVLVSSGGPVLVSSGGPVLVSSGGPVLVTSDSEVPATSSQTGSGLVFPALLSPAAAATSQPSGGHPSAGSILPGDVSDGSSPPVTGNVLGAPVPPPLAIQDGTGPGTVVSNSGLNVAASATGPVTGGVLTSANIAPTALAGTLAGPLALLTSGAGQVALQADGGPRQDSGGSAGTSNLAAAAGERTGLAGPIGRPAAGAAAPGTATQNGILADGGQSAAAGTVRTVPAAGFSLGSSPDGQVLPMSIVPRLATRGGSTLTSASFNLQAVPGAPGTGETGAGQAGGAYMMAPMLPRSAGQQAQERTRQAFAPEDEESWDTAPRMPAAPVRPDDPFAPGPHWPDSDPGPFTATGIGAGHSAGQDSTTSDGRTR
jgi:hypothetical protein